MAHKYYYCTALTQRVWHTYKINYIAATHKNKEESSTKYHMCIQTVSITESSIKITGAHAHINLEPHPHNYRIHESTMHTYRSPVSLHRCTMAIKVILLLSLGSLLCQVCLWMLFLRKWIGGRTAIRHVRIQKFCL